MSEGVPSLCGFGRQKNSDGFPRAFVVSSNPPLPFWVALGLSLSLSLSPVVIRATDRLTGSHKKEEEEEDWYGGNEKRSFYIFGGENTSKRLFFLFDRHVGFGIMYVPAERKILEIDLWWDTFSPMYSRFVGNKYDTAFLPFNSKIVTTLFRIVFF